MDEREQRIREQAYKLWEAEGCPQGRADHHWLQAEKLIPPDDRSQVIPAPPAAQDQATAPLRPEVDPNVAMTSDEHEPVSEIDTIRRTLEVPAKRRGKRSPVADREGALSGLDGATLRE
ncbi:DUF2934 domain-containing protein [Ancylobacter sp. Lp-2]|uniref:DUF2934 domain-containing protein n=1 Tax=Ancylobacter sp. Lp-2 TaxID=2881339 RepID=UPI001E57E502|nr:DUF2934 domain-containing protein [Ancylobacter sp. Lp-2]MCB4771944.1 DUF2934 domain-containing protein [Ancylobacter sp. Lp-2]